MITKKISLKDAPPVLLFIFSLVLISCGGGSDQNNGTALSESSQRQGRPDEPDTCQNSSQESVLLATVYANSPGVKAMISDDLKAYGDSFPTTYDRDGMVRLTVPYIKRMRKAQRGNSGNVEDAEFADLCTEKMLVYIDKHYIDTMFSENPGATGLIGIFATQMPPEKREKVEKPSEKPINQTIILVPFDVKAMKALGSGSASGVVGYQRWPTDVVVQPLTTGDVKTKVEGAYDQLEIK